MNIYFQIKTMTDKPDSYAGFNEYNPLLDTEVSGSHIESKV